jgi:hypothetical protein
LVIFDQRPHGTFGDFTMKSNMVFLLTVFLCVVPRLASQSQSPNSLMVAGSARYESNHQPLLTVEPALVLTRRWLPDDVFRLQLPIAFNIKDPQSSDSTPLLLTDIRFLGEAGDWKKARLNGIAIPGTAANED